MSHVEQRTGSNISLQDLRRPLYSQEPCLSRRAWADGDLVRALQGLLDQDDENAAAVAEALVLLLIDDEITKRLFDARNGTLQRFTDRLEKAVDSFDASLR